MKKPDIQPKAYNLLSYDSVFVVLKSDSSLIEQYAGLVKYDRIRKKHYIPGRLITKQRIDKVNALVIRYPRYRTLSLIHLEHTKAYEQTKREDLKEQFIFSIPYAEIDCVILPFDALDWKK